MRYNLIVIKTLIRLAVFGTISLKIAQYVIGAFQFGDVNSILLYILALTVLYFFMRPILSLISLPSDGAGFLFMSFILTSIASYVLTLFIPLFSIRPTVISELIIFGFVLPSKRLDMMWALIFSALLMSVLMLFFDWLTDSERR